jgi:hypothetical protein
VSAEVAPRPGKSSRRPELREVPRREGRIATVPFVLVVALVLGLGMVGMLVLTTALQEQAFAVQRQQHQANVLASQVSQLQAEVADARSVKSLAIAAAKLGMRPNPYAVPLRLSDGKVLGKDRPVLGNEIPGVRYLTPEEAQAQVTALDNAEKARIAKAKAEREKKKAEAAAKAQAEADAKAKAKADPAAKTNGAKKKGTNG